MPRRPGLVLQGSRNEHGLIPFSVDPRDLDIILRTVKCLRSSALMPTINCLKILNPITIMFFITYYLKKNITNLRDRMHNYSLPAEDDRNFINRILYKNLRLNVE